MSKEKTAGQSLRKWLDNCREVYSEDDVSKIVKSDFDEMISDLKLMREYYFPKKGGDESIEAKRSE